MSGSSKAAWGVAAGAVVASVGAAFVLTRRSLGGVSLDRRFAPPSQAFPFGTDELGRDLVWRTAAAAVHSTTVVLPALVVAAAIGLAVGTIAGLASRSAGRRWITGLLDQLTGVVWAIPGLVFFIAITTLFGYTALVIALALASVSWVPIARVLRLELERELQREYVRAQRALGLPWYQTLGAVIATVWPAVGVVGATVLLDLIASEASLAFLGLGVQPPTPSLGGMIYSGLYYSQSAWWLLAVPSAALIAILWLAHRLGRRTGER